MPKVHSEYVCQQCGYKNPSFLGKCPECGEWNSLVETKVSDENLIRRLGGSNFKFDEDLVKLTDVKREQISRISAGFSEFDRVLGGGIVPGSIILIAGDPGIGKSTLLLQSAIQIAKDKEGREGGDDSEGRARKSSKPSKTSQSYEPSVLYVTGEESPQQVKIRADRLVQTTNSKLQTQNLFILPQTDANVVVAACEKLKPKLVIVDSIQTLTTDELTSAAGSVGQVRQCAQILQRLAKKSKIPIFLVGHVTKEGAVAGPKVLEHLVDAVLNLEGDGTHAFRILRSTKNRFGSTFEVGVFEMTDGGLIEVSNPSQIFLSQRLKARPGSVVTSTIAGGRPILAEVQALCTPTIFGIPTRRVTGLEFSRIQIVIAALSRLAKLPLANQDIFVNVAGGLKVTEPAADLAAALAIVSATLDKPVGEGICAFGEVGLLGELRLVSNLKSRIGEAKRLGFGDFVTPEKFKTLEQAIAYTIHGE